MSYKVLFAAVVLIEANMGVLRAQTVATYPLADQADAILVGEVQSGHQSGNSLAFTLNVVRTVKGSALPGSLLNVSGSCTQSTTRDLTGTFGMFFLGKTGTGQWTLLPVARGTGLAFESASYQIPRTSSPTSIGMSQLASSTNDLIALELAAGIQAYTGPPHNYGLYQMEAGLMGLPVSRVLQDLLQTLRASSNPEARFLALASALRGGDASALGEVAAGVALLPQLAARAFVIPQIYGQRNSDSASVGYLAQVAASPDATVQRSAADALARIHTQNTLPILAGLLASSDARTRELAIIGLSRFVDNLPVETPYNVPNGKASQRQGPTPYRTSQTDQYSLSTRSLASAQETEAAFLQFWASWWLSNENKLSGNAAVH